jgi:hypothetical protein
MAVSSVLYVTQCFVRADARPCGRWGLPEAKAGTCRRARNSPFFEDAGRSRAAALNGANAPLLSLRSMAAGRP